MLLALLEPRAPPRLPPPPPVPVPGAVIDAFIRKSKDVDVVDNGFVVVVLVDVLLVLAVVAEQLLGLLPVVPASVPSLNAIVLCLLTTFCVVAAASVGASVICDAMAFVACCCCNSLMCSVWGCCNCRCW